MASESASAFIERLGDVMGVTGERNEAGSSRGDRRPLAIDQSTSFAPGSGPRLRTYLTD